MMNWFLTLLTVTAPVVPDVEGEANKEAPEQIVVSGRALQSIGTSMSGSSGTVGYEDLKDRPIARVGEVLEVVPGLIATQHSGTGKANQFFLRGFNLDHGTDFATFVDGVPINMRSHGHGQGYTDLNILIPELVERVDFNKGNHHAEVGDFSSAGSVSIRTYDRLEDSLAKVTFGSFGYRRALLAGSFQLSDQTTVLGAVEEERYDGPFEVEEDLEKINGFLKISGQNSSLSWRVSVSGYDADWNSTDQVPQRLVDSGDLDRFGSLDPDLGGNTSRYSAAAEVATQTSRLSAYLVDYDFQLFSNFTYFLGHNLLFKGGTRAFRQAEVGEHPHHSRPVNGDEFEQIDRRKIYGANLQHSWDFDGPLSSGLQVGAGFRRDDIGEVGLYGTRSRERHTLVRNDSISSTSYSGYARLNAEYKRLRVEAGLRIDVQDVDVTANRPANSGSAQDTIISPSFSAAYRVSDHFELYANYGEGFHSNDARGATLAVDPSTGSPADNVPLLVKSRGAEFGMRYETGFLKASVVGFWLGLDSELVYVGDAGVTEVQGSTRRFGFETNLFWQATRWANIFASYSSTDARFRNEEDDRIPNSVPSVLSAGVKLQPSERITSTFILRRVGASPLVEDNSVRSEATTSLNWGGFYRTKHFRFGLEVLNLLDSMDADISYYFESQLLDELKPVADVHAHPMAPRQIRFSMEAAF